MFGASVNSMNCCPFRWWPYNALRSIWMMLGNSLNGQDGFPPWSSNVFPASFFSEVLSLVSSLPVSVLI